MSQFLWSCVSIDDIQADAGCVPAPGGDAAKGNWCCPVDQ